MFKRTRSAMIIAALMAVAVAPAHAQTHRSHIGPRVSYNFDAKAAGLGMQIGLPLAPHLEFYPSADVFLVDRGSLIGVNADLKYRAGRADASWFYLGGGLNIANRKVNDVSHTDSGLNLFMGIESLRGRVHPFGEMRVTLSNGSTAQLLGGLNFTM